MENIEEFYAVTLSSVYHVKADGEYRSSATKIALSSHSSMPVGGDLGDSYFYMIGIGKGLQAYAPEKYGMTNPLTGYERNYNMVNTRYHGVRSTDIVALFTDKDEALRCSQEDDRKPADSRWIESTRRVLEAIGEDHPSFFVSHFGRDKLLS